MIWGIVAGASIIIVTGADLLLTVLHPTRRGVLSRIAMAATWRGARAVSSWSGTTVAISYAGPLMMVAQFATWVVGVWIGFALIYVGHLSQFGPPAQIGAHDFFTALYLSGATLTTLGPGNLTATTEALRLVTVLEAASGLAVIGAAIAYLLAVYPLVSEIRITARELAPARDDCGAAELVFHGGPSRLEALQRELIGLDESTQRFPILYYFHADDPTASLAAAIRAASLVVMQLRFGLSAEALPHARWHGRVLEATLTRVIDHFRGRFYGAAGADREHLPSASDVDRRLRELRLAAAHVSGIEPSDAVDGRDREALARLLHRSDSFLAELEHRHFYPHEPL